MSRARGAVSLFTLFLLLALAVLAYAGWLYVPLFFDNLDVREATAAAFNRMAFDGSDERIRIFLLERTKKIGTHWESDGATRVEVRGLGLTDADVIVERDPSDHSGRVQVDYTREVRLWPTERMQVLDFHAERAGKLSQ